MRNEYSIAMAVGIFQAFEREELSVFLGMLHSLSVLYTRYLKTIEVSFVVAMRYCQE